MFPAVPLRAGRIKRSAAGRVPKDLSQARAYQARMGAPQAVLLLCPVPSDAPPDRIPWTGVACRDSSPLAELYHQQKPLAPGECLEAPPPFPPGQPWFLNPFRSVQFKIDGDSPEVELTQMRLARTPAKRVVS
ncbi:unnamed protein product [Arctogadus glacialis]